MIKNPEHAAIYHLWTQAKRRALEDHLLFNLRKEDIHIPQFCPALGIPLFRSKGFPGPNSPTLDRVNNSMGYVRGNVRVISYRANMIKKDANADELERIARYIRAFDPIREDSLPSQEIFPVQITP